MSQSLPDPLEDFLQHPPQLPVDADAQAALANQTAALLPRGRVRRRWPVLAAAAAGLLALVSAYLVWISHHAGPPKNLVEHKIDPAPEEKPKPKNDPQPKPAPAVAAANPLDVEWSAFDADDDEQRVRLYFQAGDLYLDQLQDMTGAVRCYRQALTYCDAAQLEFNPNDNWLVMALKRDFRKEN
jgi:hypothetical protein